MQNALTKLFKMLAISGMLGLVSATAEPTLKLPVRQSCPHGVLLLPSRWNITTITI